jgi:hypothetical protein
MTYAGPRASTIATLVAITLAAATAVFAQQVVPGTGPRPITADSGRVAGDSGGTRAPGAPSADRVPSAAGPGSTGTAPTPLPSNVGVAAPSDPTLTRACAGMPAGSEAPGLLAVIFRAGTSDKDRAAAAKAVGGTLAGTSSYGEDYVQLEVGAGPLAAVADRLIRQEPVMQVSPAPCPGETPAAQGVGADSTPVSPR